MAFNIEVNPVDWFESWKNANRIDRWCKLFFTLGFSFAISFAIACGASLVAGKSWPVSVGYGLILAGTSATVVFRRSDLTRGLLIALPQSEADEELSGKNPIQVIQKNN